VALVVAVTVVPEVGDFSPFRQYPITDGLGLMPCEHSSGTNVRRGGIAEAGNALARRAGAWTYRIPARVIRKLYHRLEKLPPVIRDIAWKGQTRLCVA
jgi:transposase